MRERINELVDFATSQSPYQSANKGWVSDDIYLKWGANKSESLNQGTEVVNLSISWQPIGKIISILFLVLILASTFVFSVIAITNGNYNLAFLTNIQSNRKDFIDQSMQSPNLEKIQEEKILVDTSFQLNESDEPSEKDSLQVKKLTNKSYPKNKSNSSVNMLAPKAN